MSKISCSFNGFLSLDSNEHIVGKRGLERYGRAQKTLDSEVMRLCDPYVPFRTGSLKTSAITATDIGSGVVEYNAPYAYKQYHFGRVAGQGVRRGRYWFERMKADHIDELLALVKKAAKEE